MDLFSYYPYLLGPKLYRVTHLVFTQAPTCPITAFARFGVRLRQYPLIKPILLFAEKQSIPSASLPCASLRMFLGKGCSGDMGFGLYYHERISTNSTSLICVNGLVSARRAMTFSSEAVNKFKSSSLISWKSTGKLQQTLAGCIQKTGVGLHSGKVSTVKIWPEVAGKGRCFDFRSNLIPASINFAENSTLCTTLAKDGYVIRTVEHLLSALEATGVDNCRIEIDNLDGEDQHVEVPIFDGSAQEWVEAVDTVGLKVATDIDGNNCEKMVPHLTEPVQILRKDSFVAAFPSPKVHLSCGIDFSEVSAIGCQWFSSSFVDDSIYKIQIAPSRTFCIYEEVEKMRNAELIKGGSLENALVCSKSGGWLNPPLRFDKEPCHHKALDLIGDLSLFARFGSQGIPMAHIVAFKSGHALHADFLRLLA